MSYRRREKIDIESQADFPTLGAAADTVRIIFRKLFWSKVKFHVHDDTVSDYVWPIKVFGVNRRKKLSHSHFSKISQ